MSSAVLDSDFPHFRRKFFGGAAWDSTAASGPRKSSNSMEPGNAVNTAQQTPAQHHLQRPNLKTLDLRALPRDDGPPSETQLRRQKFLFFEKQCSEVAEGLFVSGDYVARTREVLAQHGITHVINCVGFICKEYFKPELQYRTYFLQDTPAEDILCILYDAFEFIDAALASGGRVLIHCSQGVSRSATIAIAYLMWKTECSYDEVFARVKAIRGIANPNIGFCCQLLQWQKRRHATAGKIRMYRIAPHCQQAPMQLVPKTVTPPKKYANHTYRELDPRGAFIIQTPECIYVWVGGSCPGAYVAAAEYHASLLPKYESTSATLRSTLVVEQGMEPPEFRALMDPEPLNPDQERANARRTSITGDLLTGSSTGFLASDPMDLSETDFAPHSSSSNSFSVQNSSDRQQTVGTLNTSLPRLQPPHTALLLSNLGEPSPMAITPRTSCQTPTPIPTPHPMSALRDASRPSTSTSSKGEAPSWSPSEVDDYSSDYQLFYDALKKASQDGSGASSILSHLNHASDPALRISGMPGVQHEGGCSGSSGGHGHERLRDLRLNSDSTDRRPSSGFIMAASPYIDHDPNSGRPESPATTEGRLKKYRRSDSELTIALFDKNKRHWPSLHTSIDEEDLPPTDGGAM